MKKVILLLLAGAITMLAQQPVNVCWSLGTGAQTCQTFQPGTVTMITLDMRTPTPAPVPIVVIQPLPNYQVSALQSFVTGQTWKIQQADGSFVVKAKFSSIQDLLMQASIRLIGVPALQTYCQTNSCPQLPPTWNTLNGASIISTQVFTDLGSSVQIIPIMGQ